MTRAARVIHSIPGRTRLRIALDGGRADELEALSRDLGSLPGVHAARGNPLTRSVLLEHTAPIEDVVREAELRGYLRFDPTPPETYLAGLDRALDRCDERLRRASGERVSLETLTFVGFLAGGVYQVTHGHALPAGVTLLRYAVELVTAAGSSALAARAREASRA